MEMLSSQTARFSAAPQLAAVPGPRPNRTIFLVHRASGSFSPVRAALQGRGYEVIHAECVDAALRLWMKLAGPVHLFLADISLGRDQLTEQLVKLLQAENPKMRVLYANDLEQGQNPIGSASYAQQLATVVDNCLA